MSRIARSLIVLVGALALVVPAAAQAAPADRSKDDPAQVLVGRWVGTYAGYYNGDYLTGGDVSSEAAVEPGTGALMRQGL